MNCIVYTNAGNKVRFSEVGSAKVKIDQLWIEKEDGEVLGVFNFGNIAGLKWIRENEHEE